MSATFNALDDFIMKAASCHQRFETDHYRESSKQLLYLIDVQQVRRQKTRNCLSMGSVLLLRLVIIYCR